MHARISRARATEMQRDLVVRCASAQRHGSAPKLMMPYFAAAAVSVQPETLPVWMIVEALSCQLGGKAGAIGGNAGSESGDGVDDHQEPPLGPRRIRTPAAGAATKARLHTSRTVTAAADAISLLRVVRAALPRPCAERWGAGALGGGLQAAQPRRWKESAPRSEPLARPRGTDVGMSPDG